jgi:hypothetical protein
MGVSLAGAPPGYRRDPRLLGKSNEPPSVFIPPFDRIVLMAFLVIARFVPRDCQVVPTAVTNAAVGAHYPAFWLDGERRARDRTSWLGAHSGAMAPASNPNPNPSSADHNALETIPYWRRR